MKAKMQKRIALMNSAMMPCAGFGYFLRKVETSDAFHRLFAELVDAGASWASYIGYESTAAFLSSVLGVQVPVSREETKVVDGDILLICKLRYRPAQPGMKASQAAQAALAESDFEFYLCEVHAIV